VSQSLRPTEGYRILIELAEDSATGARYTGAIYLPDTEHAFEARIALPKGEVEIVPGASGEAPASAHAQLVAQLRTIARGKVKQLDQPWPRRILRWRPEKPTP
jgi:hypothetical protein